MALLNYNAVLSHFNLQELASPGANTMARE